MSAVWAVAERNSCKVKEKKIFISPYIFVEPCLVEEKEILAPVNVQCAKLQKKLASV